MGMWEGMLKRGGRKCEAGGDFPGKGDDPSDVGLCEDFFSNL